MAQTAHGAGAASASAIGRSTGRAARSLKIRHGGWPWPMLFEDIDLDTDDKLSDRI